MVPDVALLLDFLNTRNVEDDTDVLRADATWREWTSERGLRPDPLPEAVRVRDALRTAVGDPTPGPGDVRASVDIALTPTGPALVPDSAVGAVLAAAARLAVLGEWDRIKICPADTCLWAFYDRSRNRSRTWCSMRICGNREKVRAFRERDGRAPPRNPPPCGQPCG